MDRKCASRLHRSGPWSSYFKKLANAVNSVGPPYVTRQCFRFPNFLKAETLSNVMGKGVSNNKLNVELNTISECCGFDLRKIVLRADLLERFISRDYSMKRVIERVECIWHSMPLFYQNIFWFHENKVNDASIWIVFNLCLFNVYLGRSAEGDHRRHIGHQSWKVKLYAVSFDTPSNIPWRRKTTLIAHTYNLPKVIAVDAEDNF